MITLLFELLAIFADEVLAVSKSSLSSTASRLMSAIYGSVLDLLAQLDFLDEPVEPKPNGGVGDAVLARRPPSWSLMRARNRFDERHILVIEVRHPRRDHRHIHTCPPSIHGGFNKIKYTINNIKIKWRYLFKSFFVD